MFLFQHPEDGSEPCLSIMTHEDRVCLVAANPLNKQVIFNMYTYNYYIATYIIILNTQ